MSFKIVESSPQALAQDQPETPTYPYDELNVGQSFLVPIDSVVESNFRMSVSRQNKKKDGKRFRVVKHADHSVFEVARTL